MEKSPIVIVDDDNDDIELIKLAIKEIALERSVVYLQNGPALISYLEKCDLSPFFILCDVNLPGETGFDIKKKLSDHARLKYQSVPFLFWSTSASEKQIQMAYDLPAQGFFLKPNRLEDLCSTITKIVSYWTDSLHPKAIK